jgi:hypothetical protein
MQHLIQLVQPLCKVSSSFLFTTHSPGSLDLDTFVHYKFMCRKLGLQCSEIQVLIFKRWAPSARWFGHWGHPLRKELMLASEKEQVVIKWSHFTLPSSAHGHFSSCFSTILWFYQRGLHQRLKKTELPDLELLASKIVKPFFTNTKLQVFCYNNKKHTTTAAQT